MAQKLIIRKLLFVLIIISLLFRAVYATSGSSDGNQACDGAYKSQEACYLSEKRIERSEKLLEKNRLALSDLEKLLVASKKEDVRFNNNVKAKVKLDIAKTELQLEDLKLELDTVKNSINHLEDSENNKSIKYLLNNKELAKNDKRALFLINENIELTKKLIDYNKAYYSQISRNINYQRVDENISSNKSKESLLNENIENTQHKILKLTEEEHNLSVKLHDELLNAEKIKIEYVKDKIKNEIFNQETLLGLYKVTLDTLRVQNSLVQLMSEYDSGLQETNIQKKYLERIKIIHENYSKIENYFYTKYKLLNDEVTILKQSISLKNTQEKKHILKTKLESAEYYLSQYDKETGKLNLLKEKIQKQYNKNLSVLQRGIWERQKLPNNFFELKLLYYDIIKVPYNLYVKSYDIYNHFKDNVFANSENYNVSTIFNWGSIIGIWISITVLIKRYITGKVKKTNKDNLKYHSKILYIFRMLLSKNIVFTSIFALINFVLYFTGVSPLTISMLISIGVIYLSCAIILQICKYFLLENETDNQKSKGYQKYNKVYNFLRYSIFIIGMFLGLLTVTYYLDANYYLIVFIERLFMFFLLGISIPLMANWKLIPKVIEKNILSHKEYLRKSIIFFSFLFCLTLLTNSVLGFLGYVNLAWKIATAELQVIIIISIWFIVRGLLKDLMGFISDYFIQEVANGWLWSQAILKPLYKLLRVLLFFAVGLVFFIIYGWFKETQVLAILLSFLDYAWLDFGQVILTTKSILIFIIVVMLAFWLTFWSREFSYRWLYAKVPDLAIRNSLSVFTQYAVLIVSILVILQVIGISLATLTVAFGGILVVVGFGAKEISSNLFSGLMLLLERHVRVGDFISIGQYEGKVTKIGMRSFTLQTWDNTEVIVPNSETVTSSLKNLTYNDSIVRNSILIRIAYEEDVEYVRDIILRSLNEIEEVLTTPEPSVLLEEFTENAIIFRVYYYIDLQKTPVRPRVKSAVMISITKALDKAKVKVPYPKQVVNFINHKEEN